MAPPHETALVAEVPCFPGEEASEMTDEGLSKRVLSDLSKLNLLERNQVIEIRHHRLPKAYPGYALGYAEQVKTIREELVGPVGPGPTPFIVNLSDLEFTIRNWMPSTPEDNPDPEHETTCCTR